MPKSSIPYLSKIRGLELVWIRDLIAFGYTFSSDLTENIWEFYYYINSETLSSDKKMSTLQYNSTLVNWSNYDVK